MSSQPDAGGAQALLLGFPGIACSRAFPEPVTWESRMGLLAIFAVGSGAFLGAVLRWVFGLWLNPLLPALPLGTLAANLLGGLIMGLAMGLFGQFQSLAPEMRLFVATGFLGGLTTFSTFSAETVTLMLRAQYAWTFAIVGAHLLGSLLMTLTGIGIARLVLR